MKSQQEKAEKRQAKKKSTKCLPWDFMFQAIGGRSSSHVGVLIHHHHAYGVMVVMTDRVCCLLPLPYSTPWRVGTTAWLGVRGDILYKEIGHMLLLCTLRQHTLNRTRWPTLSDEGVIGVGIQRSWGSAGSSTIQFHECINVCVYVNNAKHWKPYHCLDIQK